MHRTPSFEIQPTNLLVFMMHMGYNPLRVMEDVNENNDIVELFQEDIMMTDIDEEVEPESASPEITARRRELLVKAHSAILKACWGSTSWAPKNMKVVWSFFVNATEEDDIASILGPLTNLSMAAYPTRAEKRRVKL